MWSKRRKKIKKIGVYGGTFNPIHYGHLFCAEWARQAYSLDRVLFVTAANPPNKPEGVLDCNDRHDMVVAAIAENPFFEASRVDIDHGGSGYSLLTVHGVRKQYREEVEIYFLMSLEYLDPSNRWYLSQWIGGRELFKLCRFLVFPRENVSQAQLKAWAKKIPQARIDTTWIPSPELSSTLIRNLIAQGRSIDYTTPWVVKQMIEKNAHYRTPETPVQQPRIALPDQKVERIGIYGSQFDPIHYWHLRRAEWTREEYNLDRVIFVTRDKRLKFACIIA